MKPQLKMGKKNKMSREEALQLYNDLQNSMTALLSKKIPPKSKPLTEAAPQSMGEKQPFAGIEARPRRQSRGASGAVMFIILLGFVKIGLSVTEYLGIGAAAPAEATMMQAPSVAQQIMAAQKAGPLSQPEVRILTSLDSRRAELEEKGRRLEDRENDLSKRDKEYAVKITELRELTEKLKIDRDKDEKKKSTQLDQLANVYGSMNPQEAAQLIEQLDVTIALSLLQRMPEKRMGQILPLMSPERALVITKLLSGSK